MSAKARDWTDDEVRYLVEHIGRDDVYEVAHALDRSVGSVKGKVDRLRQKGQPVYWSTRQSWTDGDDAYLRENPEVSVAEAARVLGRSRPAVQAHRLKLGVAQRRPVWDRDQVEKLVDLVENRGQSYQQAAEVLGRTPNACRAVLQRLGKLQDGRRRWDDEQDQQLVRWHEKGVSRQRMADELGRSVRSVGYRMKRLGLT